jgi:hypothetical protein
MTTQTQKTTEIPTATRMIEALGTGNDGPFDGNYKLRSYRERSSESRCLGIEINSNSAIFQIAADLIDAGFDSADLVCLSDWEYGNTSNFLYWSNLTLSASEIRVLRPNSDDDEGDQVWGRKDEAMDWQFLFQTGQSVVESAESAFDERVEAFPEEYAEYRGWELKLVLTPQV